MVRANRDARYSGFSLVEMAVVLAIVGLLLGGILLPLSAQLDQQQTNETQRRLEFARDAVLGFAATNRRLPCPARWVSTSDNSAGVEDFLTTFVPGGGQCRVPWTGYIPAVTLGLLPINSNQLFVDSWGNPIHYAVTYYSSAFTVSGIAGTWPFTSTDGIRAIYNASTSGLTALVPDLYVCSSSTGITGSGATAACSGTNLLTSNAVAVIFSTGKNTATGGAGADEAANLNSDRAFVSHTPAPSTAATGEFDDVLLWLSPYLLYNRMIVGGALP